MLKMTANCPDAEENVMDSAGALRCPGYKEFDTQLR